MDADAVAQVSASALTLGWKGIWCPGIPGEGGGASSGAVIFCEGPPRLVRRADYYFGAGQGCGCVGPRTWLRAFLPGVAVSCAL
eukprot:6110041-Pyramimonas_sp.AAC.2